MSVQALLNVNQLAARKGANELEFAVKKVHNLDASKGGPDGYLKAIIQRVEGIVIDEIRKFYPEDNFLGAEMGSEINNSNITWVLKAIDGEVNFINGYPHFALSLCSLINEVPTTAVIIDPIRREEFSASKGSGSDLNNGKIRVSKQQGLNDSILSYFTTKEISKEYNLEITLDYSERGNDFGGTIIFRNGETTHEEEMTFHTYLYKNDEYYFWEDIEMLLEEESVEDVIETLGDLYIQMPDYDKEKLKSMSEAYSWL